MGSGPEGRNTEWQTNNATIGPDTNDFSRSIFPGAHNQVFPTDKIKIEPWFMNGYQLAKARLTASGARTTQWGCPTIGGRARVAASSPTITTVPIPRTIRIASDFTTVIFGTPPWRGVKSLSATMAVRPFAMISSKAPCPVGGAIPERNLARGGSPSERDAEREKRFEAKLRRQAQQRGYQLVPIEKKPAA